MKKIARFIVYSKAAPIVAALLCLFVWKYAGDRSDIGGGQTILSILHFLTNALIGFLLLKANEKFAFDGHKNSFPLTIFFMCCATIPQLTMWWPGTIILLLLTLAICILLYTYRNQQAMGSYFAAFTLISIGSLYAPQLIFLIPALLLCCSLMQSLHLRSALAGLLGALFPYWTAFCVLFLTDNTQRITQFLGALTTESASAIECPTLCIGEGCKFMLPAVFTQMAWTLILLFPAAINILFAVKSKIQARASLLFQTSVTVVLIVASLVFPSLYKLLQFTIALLTGIIGSTLFSNNTFSRGKNIWLIILLLLWGLIVSLYLWNNFSIF